MDFLKLRSIIKNESKKGTFESSSDLLQTIINNDVYTEQYIQG